MFLNGSFGFHSSHVGMRIRKLSVVKNHCVNFEPQNYNSENK